MQGTSLRDELTWASELLVFARMSQQDIRSLWRDGQETCARYHIFQEQEVHRAYISDSLRARINGKAQGSLHRDCRD